MNKCYEILNFELLLKNQGNIYIQVIYLDFGSGRKKKF